MIEEEILLESDFSLADLRKTQERNHYTESQLEELKRVYEVYKTLFTGKVRYLYGCVNKYLPCEEKNSILVSITLGEEMDSMQESLQKKEKYMEGYMLDSLANDFLLKLYVRFNQIIFERYEKHIKRYFFLGDTVPIEETNSLLRYFKFPILVGNEKYVLSPQKSVLFFAEVTKEAKERCKGICETCTSLHCNNHPPKKVGKTYGQLKILNTYSYIIREETT